MTSTTLPAPFVYESCDVPEGQTLDQWRRARAAEQSPRRRRLRLPSLRTRR